MTPEQDWLIGELTAELLNENLGIFAGAGLSVDAGFVNWKKLLEPIARELHLDIKRETDLVSLAQYHVNQNAANRAKLNQLLVTEFSRNAKASPNHRILARLPITTFWTTNYDKLIEKALDEAGKIVDVKYTVKQLAVTKPRRDVVLYKMHGDVDHASEAVFIKDDYERYHLAMQPFIAALSGDLTSKTLLFLGFSFTDPNLDYILSRVRIQYGKDQRQHHCILRHVARADCQDDADFEYQVRKQELFVGDLLRVGIKTTFVMAYGEITDILSAVEWNYRRRTVFISGAADVYGRWSKDEAEKFVYLLSQDLARASYRVVSGFGLGIGSAVIAGVLEEIYTQGDRLNHDQLILRPFPQNTAGAKSIPALWTEYRNDMLARAGVALFLFGNKLDAGNLALANGMREEFEIAKVQGLFPIPIGITGFMAEELWKEAVASYQPASHKNGAQIDFNLKKLGDTATTLDGARQLVMETLRLLIN